jgi:dihydroorotate dehydrogenase (NAD+) catalytic subunit
MPSRSSFIVHRSSFPSSLSVRLGKIEFQNPVLLASGTFGFGLEFPDVVRRVGGIVTKAITLEPRVGNPPPRIWETPSGIINSVGLENPGLEEFAQHILLKLKFGQARVLVNVAGFSIDEYAEIVGRLDSDLVAGFELNVSCPNVKQGGVAFGQDPWMVARIVRQARKATGKLLVTKLTANFVDPVVTAQAAADEGSDAVSLINTVSALVIDRSTGKPALGAKTGGLSGPAIQPFALYCVRRVAQAVKIPVIGGGGIVSGADAIDFLCAGAGLVQIGSASLVNPNAALDVIKGIRDYARRHKIKRIAEITGTMEAI